MHSLTDPQRGGTCKESRPRATTLSNDQDFSLRPMSNSEAGGPGSSPRPTRDELYRQVVNDFGAAIDRLSGAYEPDPDRAATCSRMSRSPCGRV